MTERSTLDAVSAVTGMTVAEVNAEDGRVRSRFRFMYLRCHPDSARNNNDTCRQLAAQTWESFRQVTRNDTTHTVKVHQPRTW